MRAIPSCLCKCVSAYWWMSVALLKTTSYRHWTIMMWNYPIPKRQCLIFNASRLGTQAIVSRPCQVFEPTKFKVIFVRVQKLFPPCFECIRIFFGWNHHLPTISMCSTTQTFSNLIFVVRAIKHLWLMHAIVIFNGIFNQSTHWRGNWHHRWAAISAWMVISKKRLNSRIHCENCAGFRNEGSGWVTETIV